MGDFYRAIVLKIWQFRISVTTRSVLVIPSSNCREQPLDLTGMAVGLACAIVCSSLTGCTGVS